MIFYDMAADIADDAESLRRLRLLPLMITAITLIYAIRLAADITPLLERHYYDAATLLLLLTPLYYADGAFAITPCYIALFATPLCFGHCRLRHAMLIATASLPQRFATLR